MAFDRAKVQDVWKDAGKEVQFTVLELKRQDQPKELAAISEFIDRFQAITRSLRIRAQDSNLKVAVGFSNDAWDYLFPNAPKPKELETYKGIKGDKYEMPATKGDIFLHVRANDRATVYEFMRQVMLFLKDITGVVDETHGFRYFEGRAIIGFIDGTENPEEDKAKDYAVIGDEDPQFENGSYAFAQKWRHEMDIWSKLSTETQEKAIGRKKLDDLELSDGEKFQNAHNVVSQVEINGVSQNIVRMNVPYSDPATDITGTYFIGYARHWEVTKAMLESMVKGHDYLLSFSKILTGQLFFIPSKDTLDQIVDGGFDK
ncbi:MAG TPA: Dyp-type peroxidase [Candidatus Limosilactobacillus merdipullorum]|uniref:Dyp-type peroxidase n=1 Tax=Candidatus Limosilactobacillus merdipullorum TaxID=2838653 RepID=A0A9D1QNH7_9LACO|nr:Dyp-type peroxidase [Candidatus Limosilactobacillus merdipullorum]